MNPQEEGWPLGLRLLNGRVGLAGRSRDFNGSISFSTLVTGSPTSSTVSSSDLDTESTESFFNDNSITLGSLMGASSILHLSRRSSTGRRATDILRNHKTSSSYKPIIRPTWLFSLCPRLTTDAVTTTNSSASGAATPSLGHFLQAERRAAAATIHRRNLSPTTTTLFGQNVDYLSNPTLDSLLVNSRVVPSPSRPQLVADGGGRSIGDGLQAGGVYGSSPIFSRLRLCGHPIGS